MQPAPAEGSVLCTAKLTKLEGRKVLLEASVDDLTSGDRYVDATSLFIDLPPKPQQA